MKDIFLLDMDDTLLDFRRAERVNFSQTLREDGICADEGMLARFHDINDGLWKLLERGGIARETLKVRRFELLFGEYGISSDPAAAAKRYFDRFPSICFPFPGAKEFVRTLSLRGRAYIVTNGSPVTQRRHIADAGFEPFLSGIFISEEMGCNKPSKAYADRVKGEIAGFEEDRAIWLGDSLTSDMVCAKNANVDFVLFVPRCSETAGGAEGTELPGGYDGAAVRSYAEFLRLLS